MIILTYHNIVRRPPNVFNDVVRKWDKVSAFERQMKQLAEHFKVVPLDEIVSAIRAGKILERTCAITFDDGYRGDYLYAAPVLERFGFTATFYIITQRVREAGCYTPVDFDRLETLLQLTTQPHLDLTEFGFGVVSLTDDEAKLDFIKRLTKQLKVTSALVKKQLEASLDRQLEVPEEEVAAYLQQEAYQMMSWEEIIDLQRRGFAVGSHTRTHPALSQIDAAQLEFEICGSYRDLRERLGWREITLAYPFGKADHISTAAATLAQRTGYSCALTSIKEINTPTMDCFQLRRIGFKDLIKMNGALSDSTTVAHSRSTPFGDEAIGEHHGATS